MMVPFLNTWLRKLPAWVVYALLTLPMALYTYWLLTNNLGPDPIRSYEHEMGEIALQLIVVGLLITPLRNWFGLNLIKFRRAIGLMAFYYVLAHVAAYVAFDQGFDLRAIWTDIIKRPYITFGMLATLILAPMAVTSNNWMIRKLGPKIWKWIHRGVYLVAMLVVLHYLLLVKTIGGEEVIYAAIIAILLGERAMRWFKKRNI